MPRRPTAGRSSVFGHFSSAAPPWFPPPAFRNSGRAPGARNGRQAAGPAVAVMAMIDNEVWYAYTPRELSTYSTPYSASHILDGLVGYSCWRVAKYRLRTADALLEDRLRVVTDLDSAWGALNFLHHDTNHVWTGWDSFKTLR